jgi:hypothetical protein
MRNPNYTYTQNYDETTGLPKGWRVASGDIIVWGQTKAAARSRLLRVMRLARAYRVLTELPTEQKEEENDQS